MKGLTGKFIFYIIVTENYYNKMTSPENSPMSFDMEDSLLNSPQSLDDKNAWPNWTDAEKHTMMNYIYHHTACIEFINRCWSEGPTEEAIPRMSDIDLRTIVSSRKRKAAASNNPHIKIKNKTKSFSQMTDEEFHEYLKGKLPENVEFSEPSIDQIYSTDLKVISENFD